MPSENIGAIAREVLEGNMREIVGKMSLQEMVNDRQKFAELVKNNAEPDLASMGLDIISFNVQNFTDNESVIMNLGIDNIAQIRKSAQIARAEAERDIAMAQAAAEADVPVVVMHNQTGTTYRTDVIEAMRDFFRESCAIAEEAGVAKESLIFDPGIGFGKTPETNIEVLHRLHELMKLDGEAYPLLLGASRKSFIGAALDLPVEERMEATGAACVLGITRGASIVRVHDVKPVARMCRMTDAILGA